jgi:hypothetical protein
MTDLELAYFAGLFDGEGCVQIAHHKPQRGKKTEQHTLRCAVNMVNKKCVSNFLLFGGSMCQKTRDRGNPKWQPQWTWSISSNQALRFLKTLLPFIQLKRQQFELAIEFQKRRSHTQKVNRVSAEELAQRNYYWTKLKELKRCGND